MIISAFSGTGKSYLAKIHSSVVDLEPMDYHWIYSDELKMEDCELRKKNQKRTLNPDWPGNYIRDILYYDHAGKIVLISGDDFIVDILEKMGIQCYNIFPSANQKKTYIKRYIKRGNSDDYINFWRENFERFISGKHKRLHKIEMLDGEYLEDTLKRIRVI